ncbi:DUF4123 domain-containing protein [Salmonella enterica]|nr:DUF4123 domain-containing protein [Salmonella enterica]HCM1832760.1 DUF4123 domain-containing protein [Salmonella enterica subsp. salamae serovar 48:z81:z39]EHL3470830.1 DUF4123 domain-containing protein [Salmonella enterica]EHX3574369.1 DUF4123 domain-containing protein [Salmonella enterica]EIB6275471.1 DUF4123 domain-containing protein [Salmonella enterica]
MVEQHYAFQALMRLGKRSTMLRLYALLDGIQYDRALNEELNEGCGGYSLFSLPEDKPLAFAGPWLFDVSELPINDLAKILEVEKKYPAVSWIISEHSALILVQHLKSCLLVSFPSEQKGILRFYDCRVLKLLPEFLSQEQIEYLMKYSQQWLFYYKDKINYYQCDASVLNVNILDGYIYSPEVF